jgi:uncharacterized DUF497 family protein
MAYRFLRVMGSLMILSPLPSKMKAPRENSGLTIGMNVFGALMIVIHTPRADGSRIISVRKADSKERKHYEEDI